MWMRTQIISLHLRNCKRTQMAAFPASSYHLSQLTQVRQTQLDHRERDCHKSVQYTECKCPWHLDHLSQLLPPSMSLQQTSHMRSCCTEPSSANIALLVTLVSIMYAHTHTHTYMPREHGHSCTFPWRPNKNTLHTLF